MKFSRKLPNKEGYYWWTNFGEHTPTILYVEKEGRKFYASNDEFGFWVKKINRQELIEKNKELELEPIDGFQYGDELWRLIECPALPNGKKIKPSCY